MQVDKKKALIYVILLICLLRVIIVWVNYFEFAMSFNNPLLPKEILTYKLNFDLYLSLFLLLPVLPLFFYLRRGKFFIQTIVLSLLLFAVPLFFGEFISNTFNAINQ